MSRRSATALIAAVALVAAGCGRERLRPPDPDRPSTGAPRTTVDLPAAGVEFRAPTDWPFDTGPDPLVASTSSGTASIAIWRYPRTEPLPTGGDELETAQENLLNAAKGRDPSFKRVEARRTRVGGAPAVQIVGDQTVAGRPRRVRSTHVYTRGAELVVDQYAAPDVFGTVDRSVFVPLLRSLKIGKPAG